MTIWYSLLLFILMAAFAAILMFTVNHFMYLDAENRVQEETEKIAAGVKIINGNVGFSDIETSNYNFAVFHGSNKMIFDNTHWKDVNIPPKVINKISRVDINSEAYLLLDENIKDNQNKIIGRIRVLFSLESIENTLQKIGIVFLFAIPIYIALVVAGSLFIAGVSLKPIDRVTTAAMQISRLDLSQRIEPTNTNDEVGRLITIFNEMLNMLETAFKRERQFSSDASHELRTPLTVILLNSEEALSGEKTADEYIESVKQIQFQARKMNKIIAQLLTLTRGYENKISIKKEKINIKSIINDIVSELEPYAAEYGVSIHYSQIEDIYIVADHMLITQLIVNLVSNSCKYGKIGGNVRIFTEIIKNMLEITIKDDGIGISKEDLQHIFERFYRADKSHTTEGSGLGLSIVKWIVEVHAGTIEVKSKLSEWTEITIKIPCKI